MMYDCFISYQHEDIEFVRAIANELEKRDLVCWYAPRNVTGRYAKAIADGISHSKVFLLILNKRSAISEAVLNELEMAHNISKTSGCSKIQPICTDPMDFNLPEYQEIMYYIRRYQFIDAVDTTDIGKIADEIIHSQNQLEEITHKRARSGYVSQNIEDERLKIQNELLDLFDSDVYDSVIEKYKSPNVLDIGCGTGEMMIRKLGECDYTLLGIDKSDRQIAIARDLYSSENRVFVVADVESDNFDALVSKTLNQIDRKSFDIINISMLLLHIKEPAVLLKKIKKYLSEGGTIVIRDIDDGINFAYPDPTNAFERIYRMCDHDEQSGNRRTGRSVYHDLSDSGYSNIRLVRQGLSSIGMNDEQKEGLFQMYFPFTLKNAQIMHEKYAWNVEYKEDYLWYKKIYDSLHMEFMKPNFVFSLGFQIYTASI